MRECPSITRTELHTENFESKKEQRDLSDA